MSRICLDTSAYSQFRRLHAEAVRRIDEAEEILVPVIALGELRAGFKVGGREAANEEALMDLLQEPFVREIAGPLSRLL